MQVEKHCGLSYLGSFTDSFGEPYYFGGAAWKNGQLTNQINCYCKKNNYAGLRNNLAFNKYYSENKKSYYLM